MPDPRIIALFFRCCDALKPRITFTRDELLDVLRKLEEIAPDDVALTRLFDQLRSPVLAELAGRA